MATKIFVTKLKTVLGWGLFPCHESDSDAIKAMAPDVPHCGTFVRPRNYEFHKKYMALIDYAYDVWEPPQPKASKLLEILGQPPAKNKDQFRYDLTILCGFYDAHIRLNGDVQLKAKSISFTSMSAEDFELLYDKTIDILLDQVQQLHRFDNETLRRVTAGVEEFA